MVSISPPKASGGKLLPITDRQQDILDLIYAYRFLTRPQIQALLGHKVKAKVNIWLSDLVSKGYLEALYSKSFPENTKPAIYYSSLGAIRYHKARDGARQIVIERLYRDYARTRDFIDRCLLIADIAIELRREEAPGLHFEFATASALANPVATGHFLLDSPISPDAVIVKRSSGRNTPVLVEVLPRNLPQIRLFSKINDYIDFCFSGDWSDSTTLPYPNIFLICTNYTQMRAVKRYTLRQLEDEEDELAIQFLQASRVKKSGIGRHL
jgi:hypothetical protein